MAMRPSALLALLLAVAGCGVPTAPSVATHVPNAAPKPDGTNPDPTKPVEPPKTPPAKTPDVDPAKLGLVIRDTKPGTGEGARPGDTCYMKYRGTLKSNGQEFDSTEKNGGNPFSFQLGSGQVIKGWDLGVKGMKAGGKRTLEIPADLAYGSQDKSPSIPPNSDLVFDIELLYILKPEDAAAVLRDVQKPGTGPAIKAGDVVSIRYVGTLIDGKVFDDSEKSNKGQPVQFKVGSDAIAVKGLNAAVEGLRAGAVADVTVPPSLGMGPSRGPGGPGPVPDNSVLKFHITVVKVN